MNTGKQRTRGSFTLIELLIVMGILGLLFAILMPGVNAVRRTAYRNQARQEMSGLVSAIQGFYADYGRYPLQVRNPNNRIGPQNLLPSQDSENTYGTRIEHRPGIGNASMVEGYVRLIRSLRGRDSTDNPRGTIYLNISDRSIVRDRHPGITDDEHFVDPWFNRYAVVADWNKDGNTDTGTNSHGVVTNQTVVVWSWGRAAHTTAEKDAAINDQTGHLKSWTH